MAYALLLFTLIQPFSRCSSAPPTAGITLPQSNEESPWYHLFERNHEGTTYTYGIDVFLRSWELPDKFEPFMLVPGRAFYIWPAVFLFVMPWARTRGTRIGLLVSEFILSIGSMWWIVMSAIMSTAMRGVWMAVAAMVGIATASVVEFIRELRRRTRSD